MLFHPSDIIFDRGSFVFGGRVTAVAHPVLCTEAICRFWSSFCYEDSCLAAEQTDALIFSIGGVEAPSLDGHAYAARITPDGVGLRAADASSLITAYMTLLDRIRTEDCGEERRMALDCCSFWETPRVARRMVHFCIFPETELWELQRFLRMSAALRYSHVVLEFWGMLRYDCMPELGWPFAFTKEQLRPILQEARELGLETVPMFNHWGHASSCRVCNGKHVVLDQNPALRTYFSEDGWCWDFQKPKVRALLRQIRGELIELCGEGSYFHIGCDEAYLYDLTEKESMDRICDYINALGEELWEVGRTVLVWGDMFVHQYPHYQNRYDANCPSPESEQYMLSRLDRRVIIADWQYHAKLMPVESTEVFLKAGFSCMLCPWDRGDEELRSCVETVKQKELYGLIHTTWHTLSKGMPYVTMAAIGCFESVQTCGMKTLRTRTAALLRKLSPAKGNYRRAGWAEQQFGDLF